MKKLLIIRILFAVLIITSCTSRKETSMTQVTEGVKSNSDCPKYTGKRYICYSAKKCIGKVLSNRDPHNCKGKSKGKSIYDKKTCQCTKL